MYNVLILYRPKPSDQVYTKMAKMTRHFFWFKMSIGVSHTGIRLVLELFFHFCEIFFVLYQSKWKFWNFCLFFVMFVALFRLDGAIIFLCKCIQILSIGQQIIFEKKFFLFGEKFFFSIFLDFFKQKKKFFLNEKNFFKPKFY